MEGKYIPKDIETKNAKNYKNNCLFLKFYNKRKLLIKLFVVIIVTINFFVLKVYFNWLYRNSEKKFHFYKDFDYIHYQSNFISEKMIKESKWMMSLDTAYIINGLIRKYKPKNCLEIGVARGGSSILILNAIKDLPDSRLVSIDLFTSLFVNKIGYLVSEKFPELMNKWKLFIGDMPHKFLIKLNLKFDFLFLDTAHVAPGEFFNLIECLPFLKKNAIVVLHDTIWHLEKVFSMNNNLTIARIMPTQIFLMSALNGEKIMFPKSSHKFINIGVVCLGEQQEKYYLNYFLLFLTVWHYLPTNNQLNDLRKFINKYYHSKIFLNIFDSAVYYNKNFFKDINESGYVFF